MQKLSRSKKNKGAKEDPDSYRPVSLLAAIAEKMLVDVDIVYVSVQQTKHSCLRTGADMGGVSPRYMIRIY